MAEVEATMKTEIMTKRQVEKHRAVVIIKAALVKPAVPEFHQKNIYSN